MQFSNKRNFTRWFIIFSSFIFIVFILWNTYSFFQIFKNEERLKMEYWSEAQKTLITSDINTEVALPSRIIGDNKTIPIILTDEKGGVATVVATDLAASNGLIHVLDAVVLPK